MTQHMIRVFPVAILVATAACATSPRQSSPPSTSGQPAPMATPAQALARPVTTVILVRHAEKADNSADAELSAAGVERAKTLVEVVRNAGVSSIITTQYRRTRATAAPASSALGVTPVIVSSSGEAHAQEVADSVRARPGKAILVVGHSNTVPAIIAALGGSAPAPICNSEYDDVFVVTIPADRGAPVVVVRSRYGEVSPRGGGCPAMR